MLNHPVLPELPMPFCTICAAPHPENTRFCAECGTALQPASGSALLAIAPPPVQPAPPPVARPVAAQPVVYQQNVVIMRAEKSVGVAILLTFLFGPLGMLYSTVVGALVMFVTSVMAVLLTFGVALLITWPICIIWAAVAADTHNKQLRTRY